MRRRKISFQWVQGEAPPQIEEHSRAKLDVLRQYLRAYFDRLAGQIGRDEFRLDLVDGFAGGGAFTDGGTIISGTPLIMIEESRAAAVRLNAHRKKPLRCDFKYYFTDVERAHTDYLCNVLDERGCQVENGDIVVKTAAFEDALDDIISAIRLRQPRAGRSIFLLDQCGYSDVWVGHISRIFGQLATAEVILTFAADSLVNYLSEKPEHIRPVLPIALSDDKVREIVSLRDGAGGRALVQRALRPHLRSATGAEFDTPFFIRPRQSRRALWFLHLSRHPTACDVMIQCHWKVSNMFEHYGRGDFGMLGWDALSTGTLPLFNFGELEAKALREQLLGSMPPKLLALAGEDSVTTDAMRHMFANETAARFSDLDAAVPDLFRGNEIDVLDADGKALTLHH